MMGEKDRLGRNDATEDISRKLRSLYKSVQDEGVPDRFRKLLDELDEAEETGKGERKS